MRIRNIINSFKGIKDYIIESDKGNVDNISSGIISMLGYDYIQGYPASFYLLFKRKPTVTIDIFDMLKSDDDTKRVLYSIFKERNTSSIQIKHDFLGSVLLYSRIKNYTSECSIKSATTHFDKYDKVIYVEDDDYIYEPISFNRYTKESFNKIFKPVDIKDMTHNKLVDIILSFITHDKNKALEDTFVYASPELLDSFYEEVEQNKKDHYSSNNIIEELKEERLKTFLEEIDYEYKSGMITIKGK